MTRRLLALGSSMTRHSPTSPLPVREKAKSAGASPGVIPESSIGVVTRCAGEVWDIEAPPTASRKTTEKDEDLDMGKLLDGSKRAASLPMRTAKPAQSCGIRLHRDAGTA